MLLGVGDLFTDKLYSCYSNRFPLAQKEQSSSVLKMGHNSNSQINLISSFLVVICELRRL